MMTGNAQTRKEGASKSTKSTMQKSGNLMRGKPRKRVFCLKIENVAVVEVAVKYPIILTSKSTESLSTSTYGIHNHIATTVIPVNMPESISVQRVAKLWQSQTVNAALRALKRAISSELNPGESNAITPLTSVTEKRTGAVIRKKKSTSKLANGK
jgi:hypothetical protein